MITKAKIEKLEKLLGVDSGSYQLPSVADVMNYEKFLWLTHHPKMTRKERGRLKHFIREELKKEKHETGLSKSDYESVKMFILLRFTATFDEDISVGNFKQKKYELEQSKIRQRYL